jgi:hypothetical protein
MALDLSKHSLAALGIEGFALKADALAHAGRYGWRRHDVIPAFNRFSRFWIVGQPIGTSGDWTVLDAQGLPITFRLQENPPRASS